ncbi:DUF2760 domain-containing protein [Oligosphaera ethanolica]|uniref:DUF2760 domain-containing protein n=1 Tax=Oligosphaera ethanolica TaxID=760260 RepID=A0AAE3VI49_9BACT|nr:DUF2760 domain-containing protein [Oligosphaera ethanolica]MDQ0290879.1 hypothetical protein [Oligosphaera ethanolica]
MGHFTQAWRAFWQIIRSPKAAEYWAAFEKGAGVAALPAPAAEKAGADAPVAKAVAPKAPAGADAVYTLTLLQREARLVDFLQEDIGAYSDEQVGAAVRKIHADSRQVLTKYFGVMAIREEAEQDALSVPAGFDSRRLRLSGRVSGDGPYQGTLVHRGWVATKVALPQRNDGVDPAVICPAEVEI